MSTIHYPECCRSNIRRLTGIIGVNAETAYAMMLMTATLMDLHPGDKVVADTILKDCGLACDS